MMNIKRDFIDYYSKVRYRTKKIIEVIPQDKIDWSYKKGKYTFCDIICHIAAIERFMYIETAYNKPSTYTAHPIIPEPQYINSISFMNDLHNESMLLLEGFTNSDMMSQCVTLTGVKVTRWKWLRAMVEHEIHHRGQLYLYLNMLEIKTPPIFGFNAEEVQKMGIHSKRN